VNVRTVADMDEIRAVCDLTAQVWGEPLAEPALVRAIDHAGGYVAGAWEEDHLVGASFAFLGRHDDEVILHSHVTCAAPGRVGEGIGLGLKWHQRDWCLERAVPAVEWTYDPLVARNSWFNLTKLGARAVEYEVDFYGRLDTTIEQGEESDRCLVRWDLDDAKVVDAAGGRIHPPDVEGLMEADAPIILDVDPDGAPEVTGADPGSGPALARVHADIEGLRGRNPPRAAAWRQALRASVGEAMQSGLQLTSASRDGWYVLEPS
jgi:predicted GNAT superfamily acetyltransferase